MNTNFCYKFLFFAAIMLSAATICLGAGPKFTLVLDAGHGGRDVGCKGTYTQEKEINLRATLMLGQLIKDNCPDVNVIFTRQTDVFVPLHQRADIANKSKADLFISIHTNSGPHTATAKGFETWTMGIRRSDEKLSAAKRENDVILIEKDYEQHYEGYDPNSPESNIMFEFMLDKNMEKSVELARYIQTSVCDNYGRANRGVRQDVFLVLRETSMPACLVELGFITNAEEQDLLASDSTLAPTVQGIYEAFVKYKNKYSETKTPIVAKKNASSEPADKPAKQQELTANLFQQISPTLQKIETIKETSAPATVEAQETHEASRKVNAGHKYIYKVQVLTSNRALRSDSKQLKGHTEVESYREGDLVKYTIGASENYDEMAKLRRKLLSDFPEAFVIAFKDGEKILANDARLQQKQDKATK